MVLKRSLESIDRSDHAGLVMVLVDDRSDDCHAKKLIRDFNPPGMAVIKLRLMRPCVGRPSMYHALRMGWDVLAAYLDCDCFGVLDSDVEVKRDWLDRLLHVERMGSERYGRCVVGGFRAHTKPVLESYPEYWVVQHFAGINSVFKSSLYPEIVRPALSESLWDYAVQRILLRANIPVLLTRPSVVQHIGRHGTWSYGIFAYAVSLDYHFPFMARSEVYYQMVRPVRVLSRYAFKVLLLLYKMSVRLTRAATLRGRNGKGAPVSG